ncbi:hypothetical protein [Streptomyces sp. WZ-12]|uniref:hypothetical protein n=1 Tax=Streptomyces sp. WZ-12 TaxID=3030210 RepID=UPI00238157F2|nr:hypothetical protein [Streptomyces sp. WZ-12]
MHAPHAAIVYPQVTSTRQFVTQVTLHLGENLLPVAEVSVAFSAPLRADIQGWLLATGRLIPEKAPVHLVYGSGPHQKADFFGYVQSYSIVTSGDDTRFTRNSEVTVVYTLVGAADPLQTQANRTWLASSPSYIARTICRRHLLAPMIQRDLGRLGARAQNARSDWGFLRDLVDECGLRVIVDNTDLYVTDPLVSLREGQEVPAFFLTKLPGIRDTVFDFRVTSGELDPTSGRRTRSEAHGYNRSTRHLFRVVDKATAGAGTTTFATQLPSASQTIATRRAVSQAANAQLWVQATARVRGDARVRPGTEVWMQGAGMGPRNVGQWMVMTSVHHLQLHHNDARKSVYELHLGLGRTRPEGLDAQPRSQVLPPPVRTVLAQGRWRAEHTGAA